MTTWSSTGDRRPPSIARIAMYTVLIALSLIVLVPIVWAVLSSFKTQAELAARPPTPLPGSFAPTNYTEALRTFDFGVYLRNSVIVTVAATALTLVINTMAAYGLAKYNFRGRNLLFLVTLGTIMIPLQVILISVYEVAADLGLVNSLWGLIIPPAATPTGVFLLRQYMLGLPDELIEASRIDAPASSARSPGSSCRSARPRSRSSRSSRSSGAGTTSSGRSSSARTRTDTRCRSRSRSSTDSWWCRSTTSWPCPWSA